MSEGREKNEKERIDTSGDLFIKVLCSDRHKSWLNCPDNISIIFVSGEARKAAAEKRI